MGWHLFILFYMCINSGATAYKIVCYWSSWAVYRQGEGAHLVKDIDPNLCTHLIYAFAKINPEFVLTSFDPWCDYDSGLGNFRKFTDLKKKNPKLKTLLAVGGWNLGSQIFSDMVFTRSRRQKFINSSIQLLREYNFDGIDLDWEFPTQRGGRAVDKPNLTKFCKEFRTAIKRESKKSKKDPLLFTIAISQNYKTLPEAYDLEKISNFADLFNLMTYDFHGPWDKIVDHNSPLYPRSDHSDEHKKFTVSYVAQFCLENNIPPEKLILGIPFYGHTFILADPTQNTPGVMSVRSGSPGTYTKQEGSLAFFEICKNFQESNWHRVWQKEYKAPYAYKDTLWIGYDNVKSVREKAKFIKNMKLGGAMIWSIEQDDFNNICGDGRYVLLNTIKNTLESNIKVSEVTLSSLITKLPFSKPEDRPYSITLSITTPSTKTEPPKTHEKHNIHSKHKQNSTGPYECIDEGIFRVVKKCSNFVYCIKRDHCNREPCFSQIEMTCPEGLVFDEENKVCNWPDAALPCENTPENIKLIMTTMTPQHSNDACVIPGIFKNKLDCRKFYECVDKGNCNAGSCYIKYDKECPAGLEFDESANVCNWPVSNSHCQNANR